MRWSLTSSAAAEPPPPHDSQEAPAPSPTTVSSHHRIAPPPHRPVTHEPLLADSCAFDENVTAASYHRMSLRCISMVIGHGHHARADTSVRAGRLQGLSCADTGVEHEHRARRLTR